MAIKHETLELGKYVFEIWKESSREWYANARLKTDGIWIYKWVTARTKKAIVEYARAFAE